MDSNSQLTPALVREQAALLSLIRERSYRKGRFKLASGRESSFYVDLKPTTLHPLGARAIGRLAVARLLERLPRVDAVGGLTLGADPIATAVSLAALEVGLEWGAFIVRKDSKQHGTRRYLEGMEYLPPGARCVVVEDVATTGASALVAVDRLRDAGYEVVAVLAVVDREEGAAAAFAQAGVPFLALLRLSEL